MKEENCVPSEFDFEFAVMCHEHIESPLLYHGVCKLVMEYLLVKSPIGSTAIIAVKQL